MKALLRIGRAAWLLPGGMALGLTATLSDEGPAPEQIAFFETRIRPVLAEHCYSCHSAHAERPKANLYLDSREGILEGGESGPAALAGAPDQSLLIKAVRYTDRELQMPPRNQKLGDRQIADLEAWVRVGLPWPAGEAVTARLARAEGFELTEKDRAYWAFQPVRRPALPVVRQAEWVANPVDAFVLAQLEARGLTPNSPAGPRELVRRLSYDLLGLPPSPAQVADFERAPSPAAYARLVDVLLDRPEYGERWARRWLDVVRYAQSNGYERDSEKPQAWRYRDYVVEAFNRDKPYDRFVREQLAGDELPDGDLAALVATVFQRLGVWDDEPDDAAMAEFDGLDDIVSTTGAAVLGLTVGCARCHDHKFDPISQRDYYQFLSFFRNVRPYENARYTLDSATYLPLATAAEVRAWRTGQEARIQAIAQRLAAAAEGSEKQALEAELKEAKEAAPPFEWALGVRERGPDPPPTHVLVRGNASSPGPEVEPAFLTVLGGERPVVPTPPAGATSSGRRRVLAEWLTRPDHPLTARVAVNRVWHHLFGQGLVRTTTDFGRAGTPPTHPELLDWLAAEFVAGGWSFKHLVRTIVLSNTYQQSSAATNATALASDPGNQWLWRQSLRRLDAESVWDTFLTISGELNPQRGGRGFFPYLDGEVLAGASRPGAGWEVSSAAEQTRRAVYMHIRRTMQVPLLELFDYSNTTSPLGERPVTTVAPQALLLLNADWTRRRAAAFAARLCREVSPEASVADRIRHAYELALARPPSAAEIATAEAFLTRQAEAARGLEPRLTFRPGVPDALLADYLNQLGPGDFLVGPPSGWSYYRGRWSGAYEGIRALDTGRAPFALHASAPVADGTIEAVLVPASGSERASLLFRARAEHDEPRGLELRFERREGKLRLLDHGAEITALADAPLPPEGDTGWRVKIALTGPAVRVWLGGDPAPRLEVTDLDPVQAGQLGVNAWGAALHLDELVLRTADETRVITGSGIAAANVPAGTGDAAVRRAWESLCLLLLNLNEVMYVD